MRLGGYPGPTGYRLDGFGHLYWLASKGLNILRSGGRETRGKGSSPVSSHFFYTTAAWASKNGNLMSPWPAYTFWTPLDFQRISVWPQCTSLVWLFLWIPHSSCPRTLCALSYLLILAWGVLPWPPLTSQACLVNSSASLLSHLWYCLLRPPPQMPSPPSYLGQLLWSLSGLGKLSLKICSVLLTPSVTPTFCSPKGSSLPGSSVREILQVRILEWVAIFSSRGSSWPREWTWVSCIAAD